MRNPFFNEVGKGDAGRSDSQESMKICTPEVGIDENYPDAQFRKANPEIGGDKALTAASLSAADRPDHLPTGLCLYHPFTSRKYEYRSAKFERNPNFKNLKHLTPKNTFRSFDSQVFGRYPSPF